MQLFLTLGVSHDMIVRVLETVFETEEGFSGSLRSRIIELIVFAVNDWVLEIRRRGGVSKGGSAIGPNVSDLLARCEQQLPVPGRATNYGGADLAEIRGLLRGLRREVGALMERAPTGSLRFM